MEIKVTLKAGAYMFSEGFSLSKNEPQILNSDTLGYADLFLLASRTQAEQVESSVSADKLFEFADKLKPVQEEVVAEVKFESKEEVQPEVLEVEAEEEVEEAAAEQDPKAAEYLELISQQIDKAPAHIAVKSIKNFVDEGYPKEFFEAALYVEEQSKNRASVVKEIKEAL